MTQNPKNIILVDDDKTLLAFAKTTLESKGYIVHAFENGLNAYEHARNTLEEMLGDHGVKPPSKHNAPFDLLLTDIIMPGMDGVELSQKMKALLPDIKVLFMTGFTALAPHNKTADETVMSKPFHLKDLLDEVEQVLTAP